MTKPQKPESPPFKPTGRPPADFGRNPLNELLGSHSSKTKVEHDALRVTEPMPLRGLETAPQGRLGQPLRMPLAGVAAGLLFAAMGLAALLAWGLSLMLDAGLGRSVGLVWAAPAAAALAVVVVAVPLALLALRLRTVGKAPQPEAAGVPAVMGPEGVSRALFADLAAREWSRSRRYGTGAALLVVQLDRFARLLEARGPAAAESAITELLRLTAPSLRAADLLTRFSECEIAVFLANADVTGALDVAERIRERAEQMEVVTDGNQASRLRVTVSVGVAYLRPSHLNLQALTEDCVLAVDAARQSGGNCVRATSGEPAGGLPRTGGWRDGSRAQP